MKKAGRFLRHFCFLIPALAALLLRVVLPHFPEFTEAVFAKGVFRILSRAAGGLISLLPFSLTEVLAVLALPAFVFILVWFIRRLCRTGCRKQLLMRAGKGTAWVLSTVLLVYMLLHGVNFYRLPLGELDGAGNGRAVGRAAARCLHRLAERASRERESLTEDGEGCARLSQSMGETLRLADNGYRSLQGDVSLSVRPGVSGEACAAFPLVELHGNHGDVFPHAGRSKCQHRCTGQQHPRYGRPRARPYQRLRPGGRVQFFWPI